MTKAYTLFKIRFLKILYLLIILGYCLSCQLTDLPPEKKLACNKPTGIYASVDNQNPKKYTFGFLGNKDDVLSVVYSLNSITIPETYTFISDGSYTISAFVTTTCQEKFTLTNTFTINTKADILSGGFNLIDPKVLSNARTLAVTNKGEIVTNDDNIIKVWNLQTNTLVRSFVFGLGIPQSMVLTPDEKYLFVANSTFINQYDFSSGLIIKQINAHNISIYDMAISGDGKKLVSTSNDKTVKTWEILTGTLLKTIVFDNSNDSNVYLGNIAVNFDGSKIVGILRKYNGIQNFYETIVWNGITGIETNRFSYDSKTYLNDVALDKAGKVLYIDYYNGNNTQIKVIDLDTKLTIKEFFSNFMMALSLDNKFIATGEQLFDNSDYTQNWYIYRHIYYSPNRVAFSSNGNYIGTISSYEGTMALATLDGTVTKQNRIGHEGFITSVNYSKDGSGSIVFDASGKAKYWDLATKTEKYTINTSNGYPNYSLMNDNYITAGFYNSFKVWNKSNGLFRYSTPLNNPVYKIASSPDNRFYIVSLTNGENIILEAETGKVLFNLSGSNSYSIFTGVSLDNKKVISLAYDGKIRIWDISNGNLVKTIDVRSLIFNKTPYNATLNPDRNNLVINYYDNGYQLLNYSISQENIASRFNIDAYPISLDFSKDGQNIVVGNSSKTVQIYNVQTGILQRERTFENEIVSVAYNASGTQIYVTTNKDFQIISAK